MKTLKIEDPLHNLLRRKAVELDSTITVLANRWMTMGAYHDGHLQPDPLKVFTANLPYASPTTTKP